MASGTSVCNRDTANKALPFLKLISSFEFLITLIVVRNVFDLCLPVTQLLQGNDNDIMDGIQMIESLKKVAALWKLSINIHHEKWFSEASDMAKKLGISVQQPRTCSQQLYRGNSPAETVSDYFRIHLTIPMFDHLLTELNNRFQDETLAIYKGLALIPSKMMTLIHDKVDWKKNIEEFVEIYADDLPNRVALETELCLWEQFWKDFTSSRPANVTQTLKAVKFAGFENIKVLLRILGTIPVTTCEVERVFSAMKVLKTFARSTMTNKRLNGLALIYIHRFFIPDFFKVINQFALKNRRLDFKEKPGETVDYSDNEYKSDID